MSFVRTSLRPLLKLRALPSTPLKMSQRSLVTESTNLLEFRDLIKSNKLSVTDFYAVWCGPCKAIAPVIQKFSEEYKDDVQFLKVDVDNAGDIAQEYGITAMPTFVLFKDGEPIGKIVGANPGGLKQAIDQYK